MFNEGERTNCRSDSTTQCSDAAANEWRKEKRKEWKNDKCRREVDEKRENEKDCEKEILEKEKESRYDDVRDRRREELECNDFHKVSHRWHDNDFEQLHEKEEFEEKREQELREDGEEEDRWINFFSLFDVYINKF